MGAVGEGVLAGRMSEMGAMSASGVGCSFETSLLLLRAKPDREIEQNNNASEQRCDM